MTTDAGSADVFARSGGEAVEMFSLWADANQQVLRELADWSAAAAREGVRLYAELLSSAVEAMRDGQAFAARRRGDLQAAPRDLVGACQAGALDAVEGVHRAWRVLEDGAQAMARSAERLQVGAEQTGRRIQETIVGLADRAQSLYTGA
jgi:hypothetical protein